MKKKKEETKGLDVDGLFDYQDFEREAISGLLSGKSLLGSEGVLTAMVQRLVNLALKGEMRVHVESEKDKGIIIV